MQRRRILERFNGYKLEWLHDSFKFIVLVIAVFVLFRFIIGLSVIGGDSMSPALKDKEIVVYLRIGRSYQPGDIVTMRVPSGEYYIKRVVALGGDEVDLHQGEVLVNRGKLYDPWGAGRTEEETGAVIYPYQVNEGNVFVLGDNREGSMDSRTFGEVNLRQIKGRIIFRLGRWYIRKV